MTAKDSKTMGRVWKRAKRWMGDTTLTYAQKCELYQSMEQMDALVAKVAETCGVVLTAELAQRCLSLADQYGTQETVDAIRAAMSGQA